MNIYRPTLEKIERGELVLVRCQSHRARDRLKASLGGALPPHAWTLRGDTRRGCYPVPKDTKLPKGVTRWRSHPDLERFGFGSPFG